MTTDQEKALEEMARRWGHSRAADGGNGRGADGLRADQTQRDENGARTVAPEVTGKSQRVGAAVIRTSASAAAIAEAEKIIQEAREQLKSGPERTPPNKYENNFMIDLMVLRNALRVRGPKVKERLKKVNKHAERDLGLLFSLVDRLQVQLASTMPASRDEYYSVLARNGTYHLSVAGPIRQGHTVVVTDANLAYLCEVAIEQECLTCLRDGSEIRQCPLRKALMEVAPAMEMKADPGERCEYANVHRQLMHGENVTI